LQFLSNRACIIHIYIYVHNSRDIHIYIYIYIYIYINCVLAGIKEIWEDLNGFKILDETDENKVTLPVKWFPLIPGEQMVAVLGKSISQIFFSTRMKVCLYVCTFILIR
jgi:hypothetical protein